VNEIHQHPDGGVYVRTAAGTYFDTRENLMRDFGLQNLGIALPQIAAPADEHIYTQGKRHAFMGRGDVIGGGPLPWPEGDAIIGGIADGLAKQAARIAAGTTGLPA
jgi:hypothetical protein